MADKGNLAQADVEALSGDNNNVARLALSGELNFETVSSVLEKIEHHLGSSVAQSASQPLTIDLARVTRCNSAALALLVECKAIGRRHSSALQFTNVPSGVMQLAEVCEAQSLLQ